MSTRETRQARLRAILSRDRSKDTEEIIKARIRESVEQGVHICPHCGFDRYTGGIHPFNGISGETKNQTRFCNGSITIDAKEEPHKFEWVCKLCAQHWMYNQQEIEIADSDGSKCHECAGKGK